MRSSKKAGRSGFRLLGPVRYGRVALLTLAFLACAELSLRSVRLYPYDPARRFNFDASRNGIAPNARQLAEAIDEVRARARPGDWVLVGDSVLAGADVPLNGAPATLLREALRKARPENQVWDLTLPGEEPAISAAILSRLGRLPGVKLLTDINTKIVGHQERSAYFAQTWDSLSRWDSNPPALQEALRGLKESFLDDYKPSGTYGDNAAELRAQIWLNSTFTLLSLDHWFRYRLCAKSWTRLPAALLIDHWRLTPARDYDVSDIELFHQEQILDINTQSGVAGWWGTEVPTDSPMWQGVQLFMDQVAGWGKDALLSLHTVSFGMIRQFRPEYRQPLEHAYLRLKDAAVQRGIAVLEPGGFVDELDYADADHFRTAGNRRWIEKAIQALPL